MYKIGYLTEVEQPDLDNIGSKAGIIFGHTHANL